MINIMNYYYGHLNDEFQLDKNVHWNLDESKILFSYKCYSLANKLKNLISIEF